jgi:hypothetical protein
MTVRKHRERMREQGLRSIQIWGAGRAFPPPSAPKRIASCSLSRPARTRSTIRPSSTQFVSPEWARQAEWISVRRSGS